MTGQTISVAALAALLAEHGGRPVRLALRIEEAASALGVSVDHFARHIAPDLRIVRQGRVKLVPVRQLEEWLEHEAAYALDRPASRRGSS